MTIIITLHCRTLQGQIFRQNRSNIWNSFSVRIRGDLKKKHETNILMTQSLSGSWHCIWLYSVCINNTHWLTWNMFSMNIMISVGLLVRSFVLSRQLSSVMACCTSIHTVSPCCAGIIPSIAGPMESCICLCLYNT
jgi:hypothetical protein